MLGNRHFYHEIIKKNVKAFGTLFNNIQIEKKDPVVASGSRQFIIYRRVPELSI